jgi:hypothetical protein
MNNAFSADAPLVCACCSKRGPAPNSCKEDPWQFAVEIQSLRAAGLTNCALRVLLHQGHIEHAEELPPGRRKARAFRKLAPLALGERTCFVLTPAGARHASAAAAPARPHWQRERRRLSFAGQLVKVYRQVAFTQVTVLAAFQEEDWPERIDDPLPRAPGQDPSRRLADTIKNLNRHQVNRLIRFSADGTGRGVCWEVIS